MKRLSCVILLCAAFCGLPHSPVHAQTLSRAERRAGTADAAEWIGLPTTSRAPGPDEVYAMFKGRKLLKSFNKKNGDSV